MTQVPLTQVRILLGSAVVGPVGHGTLELHEQHGAMTAPRTTGEIDDRSSNPVNLMRNDIEGLKARESRERGVGVSWYEQQFVYSAQ